MCGEALRLADLEKRTSRAEETARRVAMGEWRGVAWWKLE